MENKDNFAPKAEEVVGDKKQNNGKNTVVENLYEWFESAIFAVITIVLIFSFVVRHVEVFGPSMQETLHTGERIFISNLFYTPNRGDIVVVNQYPHEPLIKRIIAVEGDELCIDDNTGDVYLNGELQNEAYVTGPTYTGGRGFPPDGVIVPAGCVFVMGDNRGDSTDSRDFSRVGFVEKKDIVGKAIFRFLPMDKFGGLYN